MQNVYFGVFLGELHDCPLLLSNFNYHNYRYFVSDAANSTWSTEGVITVSVDEDEQMRVYRDQVCSVGGDLCWLFHLHLLSSVVYPLFLDIEVIIEGLHTCI